MLHIAKTMWKRGKDELTLLGVEPEAWFKGWFDRIQRGDAVAFGPHAILGWDWESPGVCNTSFQASTSFELPGVGKSVTKEMRRVIPQLAEGRKARLICTYSFCIDPEAPKWFRLIGLQEDLDYRGIKRGPYTSRRFIRRS